MDSKVDFIADFLGLEKQEVALVLYTYLSKVLEDLVHNRHTYTLFGELILDENNDVVFSNGVFDFDNELFSKKDILSILKVVEHGPGKKVL